MATLKACSKCGAELPRTKEYFDWSERDGLSARCKSCRKKHGKRHYSANKQTYYGFAEQRRKEIAALIVSLKSKPCKDCGNRFSYYVMDFDHLHEKEINLSSPKARRWGKERVLNEVSKCDLVGSNCHRTRTHTRAHHND